MKYAPRHLIAAGLMAALGLAAVAQTAAPASPGAPAATAASEGHRQADPQKMQKRMERMQQRMAKRMAAFKEKLQLSPGQEGAWTAYTEALKPTARQQRPDRAEFARLTTPERIDRMRAVRQARAVEMDKRADATKAFYAVLSAEQKKVFDDSTLRRGHRGHHRHHGDHHRS